MQTLNVWMHWLYFSISMLLSTTVIEEKYTFYGMLHLTKQKATRPVYKMAEYNVAAAALEKMQAAA